MRIGIDTHAAEELDVLHVQFIAPPMPRGGLVATIHDLGFLHFPRTFPRLFRRSRILIRRTAQRAERFSWDEAARQPFKAKAP